MRMLFGIKVTMAWDRTRTKIHVSMVWAWMHWQAYAFGVEHHCDLGADAPVIQSAQT